MPVWTGKHPFPLLLVENRYISVFGPEIEFKLPSLVISDSQQLNFGIVAQYDESGYEQGDAKILNGMRSARAAFGGANVAWKTSCLRSAPNGSPTSPATATGSASILAWRERGISANI